MSKANTSTAEYVENVSSVKYHELYEVWKNKHFCGSVLIKSQYQGKCCMVGSRFDEII